MHPPIVPDFPSPDTIHVQSGREPLWVNLGYWRDLDLPSADNRALCAQLLRKAQENLARLLGDTAKLGASDDVLDCGFGYGDQDLLWMEEYKPRHITGINITPIQVEIAKQRVRLVGMQDRIAFSEGSATALDFQAKRFNVVFALECAFHFNTREAFIKEAFRVLCPGGRLVTADWTSEHVSTNSFIAQLRRTIFRKVGFVPSENIYSMEHYRRILEHTGFTEIQVEPISQHVWRQFSRARDILIHLQRYRGTWIEAPGLAERDLRCHLLKLDARPFERLPWPRKWGIDEYCLVFAKKPA
jgi:ubiquinone/menaquinone biosynthesis C-methylase UbiE